MRTTLSLGSIALAALLSACSGQISEPPGALPTPTELTVRTVAWNSTSMQIGTPAAIVEEGASLVLFSDTGTTVFSEGVVALNDSSVRNWRTAVTLPAADGSGAWVVGIDAMGQMHRLRADMALEAISDRYGLAGVDVQQASPLGGGFVMFSLPNAFALSNGTTVTRYDDASYAMHLAGGGGRAVGVADGMVRVLDAPSAMSRSFPLPGASRAVVDPSGRLVVATDDTIYVETADGALEPRYRGGSIRALATAGSRVWFVSGSELGILDGSTIAVTHGRNVPSTARLQGSPSGDVWVFDGPTLQRLACDNCMPGADAAWRATIQPIFSNSCAQCHRPGGIANIDLSTYQSWVSRRDALRMRVIVRADMPPPGNPLSATDRAAIGTWLMSGM